MAANAIVTSTAADPLCTFATNPAHRLLPIRIQYFVSIDE
jgi:hypothetical protein